MIYRFIITVVVCSIMAVSPVVAADQRNAGLSISPVRQELSAAAGESVAGKLTVANRTDKEMIVDITVKSFSVADHTYDYQFKPLEYDWVELGSTRLSMHPRQESVVPYDVVVPRDAASGGYYFVLLASTSMKAGGVTSTVQAALPLYVTVDGNALRRSSVMENAKVPFLVTGDTLAYSYDVKNTGNVHLNGHFTARLEDLFGNHMQKDEDHTVFPGTTRTISGTLQAPLLPGVYRLVYGYAAPFSDGATRTAYLVNLPPWFVIAAIIMIVAGGSVWSRLKRHQKKTDTR